MFHAQSNQDLLDELNEKVEGHIAAKKSLINMLNRSRVRHYQKYMRLVDKDYLVPTSKVMILGASGTGKTHLVETLHDIFDFPLVRIDATELNPQGASGGVKAEDLHKMIVKQANTYATTKKEYHSLQGAIDRTVVFIDEIDKLGRSFDSSGNWNKHTQSNFLTTIDNKNEFAGVSFILAGAFTSITAAPVTTKSLGFSSFEYTEKRTEEIDDLVVASGILPELVGRMTSIVELDRFTEEDYYRILNNKLLPKKQIDLAAMGIFDTEISEDRKRAMCKKAIKSEMGVRFLHRELEKAFLDIEFDFAPNRLPGENLSIDHLIEE